MSADSAKEIFQSPLPKLAAVIRYDEEKKYGNREGQQERLGHMVTAGIFSEVLDLIEALETPPEEATQALISTYENASNGLEYFIRRATEQGQTKLAEENRIRVLMYRSHASMLRSGERTAQQEIEERIKERERLGYPNNEYQALLSRPVFPR